MNRSKLTPLATGALLALAASGCASDSTPHSAPLGSIQHTRMAETLRVYEGPLSVLRDIQPDVGALQFTQLGERTMSLFLDSDDLSKLEALDKTRPYEVRYWYYEERSDDFVWGHGELASVRGADGMVLDHSRCSLHGAEMVRRSVPVRYEFPMKAFIEASNRDFPHSASALGGCVITNESPKEVPAYVCAKCDAAAEAWSAAFSANQK